jgi:hypothetical protein
MSEDIFKSLDPNWIVTPDEASAWVKVRNANLPTMTGSHNRLLLHHSFQHRLMELGSISLAGQDDDTAKWCDDD